MRENGIGHRDFCCSELRTVYVGRSGSEGSKGGQEMGFETTLFGWE